MNLQSVLGSARKKFLAPRSSRPARTPRIRVEQLEAREVPATLPTPQIDEFSKRNLGNGFAPMTIIDPTNDQHIVTVNAAFDTNVPPHRAVAGRSSIDGGRSWRQFSIGTEVVIDPKTNTPFLNRGAPTVAFDRFNNFFVAFTRHNDFLTSGRVVVDKFNFSGGSPSFVNETIVYQWMDADAAYTPYVAIDTNLATFSDVDSGGVTRTQTDPHVSTQTSAATTAVYVAFATAADTNPTASAIKLVGSGDGGNDWSAPLLVSNEGGLTTYGGGGAAAPKILFTQGKSGDPGGRMVTVFSRDKQAIADSFFMSANFVHSVTQTVGSRLLLDAIAGAATADPHIPRTTDIAIPIAVGASFGAITDVQLTLALSHAEVKELRAVLEAPDGTQFDLFANGTDAANVATGQGISGVDLGVLGNGFAFGATFDSRAPRRITDVVAPYVGNFRPETTLTIGGWNRFDGLAANGTWKLHITDFRNGNQGTLRFATLKITSNLNDTGFGGDDRIGLPTLVSSADPAVAPTQSGFAIAADTTLGAFSPFQNRIYAAATLPGPIDRPANSDVGLVFSDDNGFTWSPRSIVNDDFAGDGFSEGRRGQFLPALAVDHSTGTLAVTYYDFRFDAAQVRAATMFTTSLDGGDSFAKSVYLNPTEQAFDETLTRTINVEPVTTNTITTIIGTVDYARSTGLAVSRGHVTAIYAGNLNTPGILPTAGSQLRTQQLTIAAGPRVVTADMGPVIAATTVDDDFAAGRKTTFNNLFGADGRRLFNGFVVTLDRFVDPASFTPSEVAVAFRSPTDSPILPGTPVTVTGVLPLDNSPFGSKRFLVFVAPQSGVGTYSYAVGSGIFDRIRLQPSVVVTGAPLTLASTDVPKSLPDQATVTSNLNIPVGTFPVGNIVASLKVTVNLSHTFDSDLRLTLISPIGTRVVLSNQRGGSGDNFTNTVFDDLSPNPISIGTAPFRVCRVRTRVEFGSSRSPTLQRSTRAS